MNFQTERVLNSLDRVKAGSTVDASLNNKGFFLDYGCYFDNENIVDKKIYKTAPKDGEYEKWEVDLTSLVAGKQYVFQLDVRLVGEVRSDFNRYGIFNGKPYRVNFEVPAGTKDIAKYALGKIAEGLKHGGFSDVKIAEKASSSTNKTMEVHGTMYSMVFDKVEIAEIVPILGQVSGSDFEYKPVISGTKQQAAEEPFGTAWFITKNLRLPTEYNTRFMSPNADEMPIDGAKYAQFFFRYRVTRDITGTDAVGDEITSITEHIVYVKQDLVSNFETIIKSESAITVEQ